ADVPANTTGTVVCTHQATVQTGTTDLNDVATATYTDKITGLPVVGQTAAAASANVQPSGTDLNASAIITDDESITGDGLTFKVASPTSGSFTNYTFGTPTTGPVSWTSGSQT